EIATDKVDSEVPSEVDGVIAEILFQVDDVVQVGQTIAIIETSNGVETASPAQAEAKAETPSPEVVAAVEETVVAAKEAVQPVQSSSERFYSPLVRNIAKKEGISQTELDSINGSGKDGRVTKNDILNYLENREKQPIAQTQATVQQSAVPSQPVQKSAPVSVNGQDEIIEMTRMGKLIAHHMVESKQTSAHVQSFIEVDVTNIWNWRNKVKNEFAKREGENLTFTPIFMEAVAQAIKDFPMINISV